jgi:hypothetical protein
VIEIPFQDFRNQNFLDEGFELYIMKSGLGDVLYIGITDQNVWTRWFGWNGHLVWDGERMEGQSAVGQKIEDHLPDSLDWKIQLWTIKDCVAFLQEDLPSTRRSPDIKFVEPYMIRKLAPLLNASYNLNPGKDGTPKSGKELERGKLLDRIYREIFEK